MVQRKIEMFLAIYHNIVISKRTFKHRLHQYGLKKRKSNISDASLRHIIEEELKDPQLLKVTEVCGTY